MQEINLKLFSPFANTLFHLALDWEVPPLRRKVNSWLAIRTILDGILFFSIPGKTKTTSVS